MEKERTDGGSTAVEEGFQDSAITVIPELQLKLLAERSDAVKEAVDVMDSTFYDGTTNDESQSLEDFYREMEVHSREYLIGLRNFGGVISTQLLKQDERHTPPDVKSFLARLKTYDLLFWANKPECISAHHCARYGWRLVGNNKLICVSCHRIQVIPQNPSCSMTSSYFTSKIVETIEKTGHTSGCIWMRSPSPLNILQVPEGRDMENHMSRASQSFKQMNILPVFMTHYRLIMGKVDLNGLKSKTSMNLTQEIIGVTKGMIEGVALFLMINGWTMEDAFENTIKCKLCLRQVPLWLCKYIPSYLMIQDIESPPFGSRNNKELDPIANHFNWCPWRMQLQSVDRKEKVGDFLLDDKTRMFSSEPLAVDPEKQPNVDDYLRMVEKFNEDLRVLDSAVASANQPRTSGLWSDTKATNATHYNTNEVESYSESTKLMFAVDGGECVGTVGKNGGDSCTFQS